jgi:hypothetical protein
VEQGTSHIRSGHSGENAAERICGSTFVAVLSIGASARLNQFSLLAPPQSLTNLRHGNGTRSALI